MVLAVGAAVAAFVTGVVAAGILLLVAAALLAALVLDVVTPLAHARSLAGFAGRSAHAWTGAGREVARLRLEARRLEQERARLQYELGEAAFAKDDERTTELRKELQECADQIAACRIDIDAAVDRARRRTSEERLAAAQTRVSRAEPE